MKKQNIIIAYPESTEQINALKAFMKALEIKFEVIKSENKVEWTKYKGAMQKQPLHEIDNQLNKMYNGT